MDPVLLIFGLLRSAVWLYGAGWAARRHRVLATAGCLLAAVNGITFSLINAGSKVPDSLIKTSTFVSGPTAVLLVAAIIIGRVKPRPGDKWSL